MEILYLLIPLSVVLVMFIIGALAWAMNRGQFDDLEHQGELIFEPEQVLARAEAKRAQTRPAAVRAEPAATAVAPPTAEQDTPEAAVLPRLDMGQHAQKHFRA